MKKLLHHFRFRVHQSFRIFNFETRIGLPFLLISVGLIIVKLPEFYYYPPLFFLMALVFHCSRKDIPFLKKVFERNWQIPVVAESLLIYTALLLININYKPEITGGIFFILIFGFAFFFPRTRINPVLSWNFISGDLFEWKSYLRKNTVFCIIAYLIVLTSSYHPAALIITGIFIMEYVAKIYGDNESKEILEMYFKNYSLKEKIRKNMLFYNRLLLPVYLSFMVINPTQGFLLLYYFLLMNLYFLLSITRKYKLYHHKEKGMEYHMGVYIEYFFYSITVIPGIWISLSQMKAAEKNIRNYVGDHKPVG